jgi:hypothetical protein
MFLTTEQTYIHVISGSDIWLEANEIARALELGGYDGLDLDFERLAVQAKVREVRRTTEYLNVNVEELQWAEPNYHGDVEVRITVPTDADLVMLRLAL